MKRIALLTGLVIALVSPVNTWAKSYSIGPVDIKAYVNSDGSMDVEEQRSYSFSGDYTFAYETIGTKGKRGEVYNLSNFTVCDEDICYKQIPGITSESYKGPTDTFFVINQGSRYYIKWVYAASNETKTFRLSYRVDNAVTLQKDVAEVYWQFVGKEWEISQSNINVTVKLPEFVDGSQIKAWCAFEKIRTDFAQNL